MVPGDDYGFENGILNDLLCEGYHVYSESWLGEELQCEREIGNMMDRYAVRVKKLGTSETVRHLP